jgi:hypothetical protein
MAGSPAASMTSWTLRVARPTDRLPEITEMYRAALGFTVLDRFADHDGFDGVILGHAGQRYHIEFTTKRGHVAGRARSEEHVLVFYIPDAVEWAERCAQMIAAGFWRVASFNPYWDIVGRTFEDLDGYRVVLENSAWTE